MAGQFKPVNLDILRRTTRADFFEELGVAQAETLWNALAMTIDSDSDQEVLAFFGSIPKPKRVDRLAGAGQVAERVALNDYGLTVVNATWKLIVPVHRDTLEDAKLDQVRVRARSQADSAMGFFDERMTVVVEANNNSYDGIAFFGALHDGGTGAAHDNDISTTGVTAPASPTPTEFEGAFADSVETMRLLEDDQNRKTNHGQLGLVAMVPAGMEVAARSTLEIGPVPGTSTTTGVFKGFAKVMVNPFTVAANSAIWYLFATSRSVKPIVYQTREDWEFQLLTSGDEWDLNDKAHMISRARWEFSGGDHKKAVRNTLAT